MVYYGSRLAVNISIHALREEGDPDISRAGFMAWVFLSTPSARRATFSSAERGKSPIISIHALREEGDLYRRLMVRFRHIFLSTPSARRATICTVLSLILV